MHRVAYVVLLLVLLSPIFPSATSVTAGAGGECTILVPLRVAVVGFALPNIDRVGGLLVDEYYYVVLGPCKLRISVYYSVVAAPEWAIKALAGNLSQLYIDRGRPDWIPSSFAKPIRWIELPTYVDILYSLALAILSDKYDHVVVVVGDVDGVSRQLYHLFYYNMVPGGVVELTGFRLWTSPRYPVTILDLTVVPRPWPEGVPLQEYGIHVNPFEEVYAWEDPDRIASYVVDIVRRIVKFHIVSSTMWWQTGMVFPESIYVKLIILYNTSSSFIQILASGGTRSALEKALHTIYPIGNITVNIALSPMNAYPELSSYLTRLSLDEEGYYTIPLEDVKPILERIARRQGANLYSPQGIYVFILLVLDKPARLMLRSAGLKFTGISLGSWALAAYPGHNERLLKAGLASAVAHELGHSLFEPHTFNYNKGSSGVEYDWRLDFAGTVMSYYNSIQAALVASPVYAGVVEKHLATRMTTRLIVSAYMQGLIERSSLSSLIREAFHNPIKAVQQYKMSTVETPLTKTVTITERLVETITETITKTATTTLRETVTKTTTTTTTEVKTVTSTVTIVETATLKEETSYQVPTTIATTMAILVLLTALATLVLVLRKTHTARL